MLVLSLYIYVKNEKECSKIINLQYLPPPIFETAHKQLNFIKIL